MYYAVECIYSPLLERIHQINGTSRFSLAGTTSTNDCSRYRSSCTGQELWEGISSTDAINITSLGTAVRSNGLASIVRPATPIPSVAAAPKWLNAFAGQSIWDSTLQLLPTSIPVYMVTTTFDLTDKMCIG